MQNFWLWTCAWCKGWHLRANITSSVTYICSAIKKYNYLLFLRFWSGNSLRLLIFLSMMVHLFLFHKGSSSSQMDASRVSFSRWIQHHEWPVSLFLHFSHFFFPGFLHISCPRSYLLTEYIISLHRLLEAGVALCRSKRGWGWREGSAKSLTKPSYVQEGSLKFIREKSLIHATIFF